MPEDIKILVIFLIIVLIVLVWMQSQNTKPIPNHGSLSRNNIQHFTNDDKAVNLNNRVDSKLVNKESLMRKEEEVDKSRSSRENQKITSKIVDNILKNNKQNLVQESIPVMSNNLADNSSSFSEQSEYTNPVLEEVNNDRDYVDSDQEALDDLIREVNTGNDLIVNSPDRDVYTKKAKSINAASSYRKVNYKDSNYRYDYNNNGPSYASESELNNLYDNALIFKNNETSSNNNFKGFNETPDSYGDANLKDFTPKGQQSQQEKVMSLYNSNEYLPNGDLLDSKLAKGFQILDNPVSVSNPNLIPVLKSIPVSSVLGSKRNSTYDIRSEPPCPKTVVSPFLNSSIMPDIYSTQRGCL